MKGIIISLKKKTKIVNMLVESIKIFVKKTDKKHQYCPECCKKFSGDKKQMLVEYRGNYFINLKN